MRPGKGSILFALLTTTLGISCAARAQVTTQPAQPRLFETVHVMVPSSALQEYDRGGTTVSMTGNAITVTVQYTVIPFGAPVPALDAVVGQLPAGSYDVTVVAAGDSGSVVATIGTAHFTVAPRDRTKVIPLYDYSDLWWNASESGWGLALTEHPSTNLFASWFAYGADGKPTWYVLPAGVWSSPTAFSGTVYKTTGPYFGGAFDASRVVVSSAGSATLTFTDYGHGTFSYTIDGVTGSRSIARQPF